MPQSSPPESPLDQALSSAITPAYLIDSSQTIVFANDTLADWVGLAREAIIGRRVEYHSEPAQEQRGEEAAGLLAGLCPTPTALAGERSYGSVSTVGPSGRLRRRRAEFFPIASKNDSAVELSFYVLALCAAEDLAVGELVESGNQSSDQLHAIIEQFRREQSDEHLHAALMGVGEATAALRRQVDAAVTSGANTLLTGAPGSGRADLARLVFHRSTPTTAARLIPLKIGLLEPDQLIGSVRSACEASENAAVTLLLQDAESAPAEVQQHMAEALAANPGVRVLATSDINGPPLADSLKSLLGTIVIQIPSLVDRTEDIPLLAQWCVERANATGGRQVAGLSTEAVDQLTLYSWPGGIAELRAVIAAAHARSTSATITAADLPTVIQQAVLARELTDANPRPIVLDTYLGRIERELVGRALDKSDGNKAEAARLLGMTRPRLYRRLARLGMLDEEESAKEEP